MGNAQIAANPLLMEMLLTSVTIHPHNVKLVAGHHVMNHVECGLHFGLDIGMFDFRR